MWIIVALLALALVFVHFTWRKKLSNVVALKNQELADTRAQQQELVSKGEAQQNALLNSMVEGLLLLDHEGRIQRANRALEKLFGITSGIQGKTIIEAFRNHELSALFDRLQTEQRILGFEIQLSEIEPRWIQVNAATLSDNGDEAKGAIFIFHDLTRLKQLENTRQEFVANVSHELRTPLSMIKGYVETLLHGAKDNPEVAEKFLNIIDKHTDRLTFLIEDLLTISRLESGQIIMNRKPAELRPAVQKVVQDLQARANEKSVALENRVPPNLCLDADFDRLEQVFWNLIDNAIKYGKTNGVVVIDARINKNKDVEIWVEDDGPGIPPDARERIFERFYRVDKARSREQGGTGLGLAIVKHVVQGHGGEVWVSSELGRGTAFHFALPQK